MTDEPSVPSEVHREVMNAVYRSVAARGYASTTIRDIAEEAGKSPSLLHYHYDTKEVLLVRFVEFLLSEFEAQVEVPAEASAAERLLHLVDEMLKIEDERLNRALFELQAQAPSNPDYREQLRRTKAELVDRLAAVVADGVATGEFRDVDPETTARFVVSAVDGARSFAVAHDDPADPEAVREALHDYVASALVADAGEQG